MRGLGDWAWVSKAARQRPDGCSALKVRFIFEVSHLVISYCKDSHPHCASRLSPDSLCFQASKILS